MSRKQRRSVILCNWRQSPQDYQSSLLPTSYGQLRASSGSVCSHIANARTSSLLLWYRDLISLTSCGESSFAVRLRSSSSVAVCRLRDLWLKWVTTKPRRKMKKQMRRRPGERFIGMPIRERWTWNQNRAPTAGGVKKVGGRDCAEPGDLWRGGENCEGFDDEEAARAAAVASLLARSFSAQLPDLSLRFVQICVLELELVDQPLPSLAPYPQGSPGMYVTWTPVLRPPLRPRLTPSPAWNLPAHGRLWLGNPHFGACVWPTRRPGRQQSLWVGIFPGLFLGENLPTFRFVFADNWREMPTFALPRFHSRAWPQGA